MKSFVSKISRAKISFSKFVSVEPILFLYVFATYAYHTLFSQYLINRYAIDLAVPEDSEEYDSSMNISGCLSVADMDVYSGLNNTFQIVQEKSTTLVIYVILVNRVLTILSTILLGPFSDFFGRRPVFLIVALGSILQGICGLLVVYAGTSLYLAILGAALAGAGGDLSGIFSAAFTYMSDISSAKWRTARLGIAEATIAVGIVVSASTTGVWFSKLGCNFGPPLMLYIGCFVGIIAYTLIVLPESLNKGERRRIGLRGYFRGFQILMGKVEMYKPSTWKIWFALIPIVTTTVAVLSNVSISLFYLKSLDWNPIQIGLYFSTLTVSEFVATIVLIPIMVAMKVPDYAIGLIGAISVCFGNIFFAFSQETYQIFSIAVLLGISGLVNPPMRGVLSKVVSKDDKGSLFSVIGSAEVGGSMVSALFLYLLPVLSQHNVEPGTIFIGVALLEAIAILFLCLPLLAQCCTKCFNQRHVERNSRTLLELKGGDLIYSNPTVDGFSKL